MRIIYLHQYFNTPQMSGSTRSYELGRRLVSMGHDVRVVTTWRGPAREPGWFTTSEAGIEVHWLPVPYDNAMSYPRRILAFLRFAFHASRRAAGLPGDLVFASSTPLTIAVPGLIAARAGRRPLVFEVRDLWPDLPIAIGALSTPAARWAARKLERLAYALSSRIVALSPGMAAGIQMAGVPPDKITVIPNVADIESFHPDHPGGQEFRAEHPELGSGPIVLYTGTLGKINGVTYAVELAAATLQRRQDVRFVIIGDGAERELVRMRALERGVLQRNFFMYPPIPKEKVCGAFAAASIVASLCIDLPELEANSANKFFDGLAAGRAVAINYGGWQEEILKRAGAGIRLSRNPELASVELDDFISDSDRLVMAGLRARQLAESEFSSERQARRLEGVLLEALGSGAVVTDRH